ncbi:MULTISPECIES: hypothetical protein [Corallococcus]|uniref:hypothetical protein n=1 Tax=Corallococcus TaxID=83461 RepID=UPI001F28D73C|nr:MULTISPECIES: hypothetical protein [Corallococcus]
MSLLPGSTDYTHRDFDALRARLVALVKSVFPEWTAFDVASFGNLLLEMHAFIGDVLGFYQDTSPARPDSPLPPSAATSSPWRACWATGFTAPRRPRSR